ncbi:CBS domain-containing protein [Pleurocapsales cyanobacterium LEGE 10410]|nr:CBS domain-containing protein [Pleurocapsales cyanobacterium LEGE 10410]
MKASDIMTKEVLIIHSSATVAEAIAMMQHKKLRSLIVEPNDDSNDYGIVTETDIVYLVLAREIDPKQVKIRQIMTKPCIVVDPDLSLPEVGRLFAEAKIQKAPVIKDKLLGIISVTDILMKTKVAQLSPTDILSQRIGEAVVHSRIYCDLEEQIDHESEIAWDVVEELESEKVAEPKMNI